MTERKELFAADILKSDHPLNKSFVSWLEKRHAQPTKRKAREFLAEYPQYREVKEVS